MKFMELIVINKMKTNIIIAILSQLMIGMQIM
jgi:hypothetical protein